MSRQILGLAAACALGAASASQAQPVYRCGNTYSQKPCAADAQPAPVMRNTRPDGATPGAADGSGRGAELCKAQLPQAIRLDDPYSAKIEVMGGARHDVVRYAGQPTVSRRYAVLVNAKNLNGAYMGQRTFHCHLSEDEARLLAVLPAD